MLIKVLRNRWVIVIWIHFWKTLAKKFWRTLANCWHILLANNLGEFSQIFGKYFWEACELICKVFIKLSEYFCKVLINVWMTNGLNNQRVLMSHKKKPMVISSMCLFIRFHKLNCHNYWDQLIHVKSQNYSLRNLELHLMTFVNMRMTNHFPS